MSYSSFKNSIATPQPIIRINKMLQLLDCSRTTLYRWVRNGQFPEPLRNGSRTIGWPISVYEEWIK